MNLARGVEPDQVLISLGNVDRQAQIFLCNHGSFFQSSLLY
jgi:hypothetical protein